VTDVNEASFVPTTRPAPWTFRQTLQCAVTVAQGPGEPCEPPRPESHSTSHGSPDIRLTNAQVARAFHVASARVSAAVRIGHGISSPLRLMSPAPRRCGCGRRA